MATKRTKLRRQIAWEAARLMYDRAEAEYYQAKMKAARRAVKGWVKPTDLPSNAEIRDQMELLARVNERESRVDALREMRIDALRIMRLLAPFRPRLIGSVLTGHIRRGSDIDLHLFSDSVEGVTGLLDAEGMIYDVERKRVRKGGEERVFTHVHLRDRYPVELTIYRADRAHDIQKSSITGKAMERASIAELELLLGQEYPQIDLPSELAEAADRVDRFQVYESLLLPLEEVVGPRKHHPEADTLYHSLQVFDLAREGLPYDEEFLLAALLHDVGKAIDRGDHVAAGLGALDGFISERTTWLIANHMLTHAIHDGTIGARARRRLHRSADFDALLLLGECDRNGRRPGAQAPELDDALDYLRDLSAQFGA